MGRLTSSSSSSSWSSSSSSESWFTDSTDKEYSDSEDEEVVVRGLNQRESRFFFDPVGKTKSILEDYEVPFKGSEVVVLDSKNPYVDFRASMADMVASRSRGPILMEDWSLLRELLEWYLKVNVEESHEVIVEAFSDLLLEILSSSSSSSFSIS